MGNKAYPMKISFVLPVYNQQSAIAQCLNSLLKQKYKKTELIVVDDGSTDDTSKIIDCVLNSKKSVKLIRHDSRLGAAVSRNEGNRQATGDIIAVCDCDIYYKDRADVIIEAFSKDKDMGVFYTAAHLRDHKNPINARIHEAYKWDFKSKCPIAHSTVAYKTEVLKTASYHEKSIDTDLYEFFLLDLHRKGTKFNGCQVPTVIKTEGNSKRNVEEAKELKKQMYKEYGIEI